MKFRVVVSREADDEIDAICAWIVRESPGDIDRWIDGLERIRDSLSQFPSRCVEAPESAAWGGGIRQVLYGPYRILFRVQDRIVTLLHVRHGARRWIHEEDR